MHRWLWLLLALVASAAGAGRLTTFAWDNGANWPTGTTVELCGNGDVCQTGITGTQATLDLPVQPGEVVQGKARAVAPAGYQCGDPLVACPYSDWITVASTWPAPLIGGWATKEEQTMADPTFQALGTLSYSGSSSVTSLSTTITNVSVGDLLIVVVQRDNQPACTGVASTSPALTFTKLATAQTGANNFNTDLWGAIATSSASSQVITASYSDSQAWGSVFSARYSSGMSSITPNVTTAHTTLQSSTTNRTNANMTTTVRTLMLAFGTNWNYYYTVSAAANWTKRVDTDTFGDDTTTQFLLERVADAGTYPSGNYGTNAALDQYISGIVALPVSAGGAATALPRRAFDGPFVGAFRGSVR